jgi:IPT/TIG domain
MWLAEREDEAMTLAKRELIRRLVGVGVAAASIVIGLETPALALPPTITSFSPTSGPAGCVVVIKGSNFDNPVVSSIDIGGTPVTSFKIVSATEIWATVAGATSGPIHLTNASDTANSPTDFTNTNPGACSPTIKSLTPCAGSAGTTVVITGTNLLKDSGTTTTAAVGGDVRFAPYAATATHTGAPETPTQLSVLVPSDAADGPIRVSTFNDIVGEGAVLSGTAFQVPPPDSQCWPPSVEHARRVTLSLGKSLIARGKVSVGDGFTDCAASVPVKVQRRVSGRWTTVRRTTTSSSGFYRERIPDRPGKYRARAPRVALNFFADICLRATSPVRRGI